MTDLLQVATDQHAAAVEEAQRLATEAHERDGGPTAEDIAAIKRATDDAVALRERREAMRQLADEAAKAERDDVVTEMRADVARRASTAKPSPVDVAPAIDWRAMGKAMLDGRPMRATVDVAPAAELHQMVRQGATRKDALELMEARALGVGTDSAGGHTVPTTTATMIYDYMHDIGGVMRAGATVMTTASGEQLELPVNAGHFAPTSTLETAEAADITVTEDSLALITLNAYKYTGGYDVSRELLEDSTSNIEQFVIEGLMRTVSIKMETRFTNGTGASMPKGITHSVPAANTTTTEGSNTIAAADLMKTKYQLDAGYRRNIRNCAWMMNSAVYQAIISLPVGTGDARPLFTPSLIGDEPDMILGAPLVENSFMAGGLADNDIGAIFGHFGDAYIVRLVGSVDIESSTHALFKKQQVAFIASIRADGEVRDQRAIEALKIKA